MNTSIRKRTWIPFTLAACVTIGYLVGTTRGAISVASAAQQAGYPETALAPDQGEPVHWSTDDLSAVHATLADRSNGRIQSQPFDLMELPFTRTHFFNVVHRPASAQPTAEQHEGVTDVYFIIGGSGTVTLGGEIENRTTSPTLPGEHYGQITGGETYRVQAGDVLAVPPNVPHASSGEEGGLTYMLLKINVGLYPWSLVAGAQ